MALQLATSAAADDFYRGKTINIIVGYGVGGGYDNAARLLSRHLGKHIPGNPSIVVQNMTGAGSLRAANHVYGPAPQDGTVIAAVNQSLPLFELTGRKGVNFVTSKLSWLGSIQASNSVVVTWKTWGVRTLADATKREVPLGGTGDLADSNVHAVVINRLLGTKFKVINGYKGARDVHLAVERGELAGRAGVTWSSLVAYDKAWIAENKIDVLVQLGDRPEPDIPLVPMLQNLAQSQDDKQVVAVLTLPVVLGFCHWMGPGVPPERLQIVRKAYQATMTDPAFINDAKRIALDVRPKTSAEVAALIKQAVATPKPALHRLAQILGWDK
jgi:tripartite-type tricarboxylate transporter receptor subunit TctC